jgi:FSR family fosmidomycin resistance protein-like MFS transporter
MRGVVGLGILLCILGALLLFVGPVSAAVVAGVGNALFHLGAGAISMSIQPGRAAAPGIFVGPGTLGLAFGMFFGPKTISVPPILLAALGTTLLIPLLVPHPTTVDKDRFPVQGGGESPTMKIAAAAMALLLISIVFRSLVGHSASYACNKTPVLLFGLAGAGCVGKMCGGLISDRLGWRVVSVGALSVAMPFLAFGYRNPFLIGLGSGLFQMTMPVTLVAALSLMPNRPAFVFGLNCLAFIIGALPVFAGTFRPYYSPAAFLGVGTMAVVAVWGGLTLLTSHIIMRFRN